MGLVSDLNERDFDGMDVGVGHANLAATLNSSVKVVRFAMNDRTEGKHSLGLLHDSKSVKILDVELDIAIEESTGTTTVKIGLGADDDGLAVDASVAATGKVRPQAAVTAGGSETYYSANTRGALLANYEAGSDAATDHGLYQEFPAWAANTDDVTYTVPSGGWTEFSGDLLVTYLVDPD